MLRAICRVCSGICGKAEVQLTIHGAYAGLKVLDFGQGIAAPYCAMLLAMHGAEVVNPCSIQLIRLSAAQHVRMHHDL